MFSDVALTLVRKENSVLLIYREDLGWVFPGGKRDYGEPLEHTAIREVFEETRVVCSFPCFIGQREGDKVRLNYFVANYRSGELQLNDDAISQIEWVRREGVFRRVTGHYHNKKTGLFPPLLPYLRGEL